MTRIALIHAVTVAIDPVRDAFAELWPEAATVNILDDSLSPDRARDADLTPEMHRRIGELGRYALGIGAEGVLYTCSAFGPAIEAFAGMAGPPVLRPNEAMFAEALAAGRRIGMLATFGPSVASMETEFRAAAAGRDAAIETVLVEDAMAALRRGDSEAHDRLLAEAAPRLSGCDAVMLAQFSTSRARPAGEAALECPVLTAPGAAVSALRRRLTPGLEPGPAPSDG